MMNLYKYMFYRFYRWNIDGSFFKSREFASMQAVSTVCCVIVIQILALIFLIEDFSNLKIAEYLYSGYGFIWVVIFLVGFVIFTFGGESGYKKIIDNFDKKKEPSGRWLVRGVLIWLYIVFWFLLFLLAVWLGKR